MHFQPRKLQYVSAWTLLPFNMIYVLMDVGKIPSVTKERFGCDKTWQKSNMRTPKGPGTAADNESTG